MAMHSEKRIINNKAAKRIVDACNSKVDHDIDLNFVADKLCEVFAFYNSYKSLGSTERQNAFKSLKKIQKTAEKLLALIRSENDPYTSPMGFLTEAARYHGRVSGGYAELGIVPTFTKSINSETDTEITFLDVSEKRVLEQTVKHLELIIDCSKISQNFNPPAKLAMTPIMRLVSVQLPEAYESIFRTGFGFSRNDQGEPSGPGMRFILQALKEANVRTGSGTPYKPETIVSYIQKNRASFSTDDIG